MEGIGGKSPLAAAYSKLTAQSDAPPHTVAQAGRPRYTEVHTTVRSEATVRDDRGGEAVT